MNFKYSHFNPTPYEVHMMVWEEVREGSTVLDVGCATGYMAKELTKKNCKVWGIEKNSDAAEEAGKYCEEVLVGDIESMQSLKLRKDFFDYILLLDVIEHLKEPEKLINLIKPLLRTHRTDKGGKIIISTPNIAHISVRSKLLFGHFSYEKMGIMDETHVRFFTEKTFLDFIDKSGLKLEELVYPADFGQIPFLGRIAGKLPKVFQHKITKLIPTLLAAQFIAVCSFEDICGRSL